MDEQRSAIQQAIINSLRSKEPAVSANMFGGEIGGASPIKGNALGGRLAYRHDIDPDNSLEFGVQGNYARGRAGGQQFSKGNFGGAGVTYRNKDQQYGLEFMKNMTDQGQPNNQVMATFRTPF